MKKTINFSAVLHYLNDLVTYWEGEYDMPALETNEYTQGNEYYQNVKESILENDLYEDIQIGFSYILNNRSIDTNKYLLVSSWDDEHVRALLTVAYQSIFNTKELLKTSDSLELREVKFQDWWFKGQGRVDD